MNYTTGVRFERLAQKMLEDDGYYVFRSAGSHGIWDLIAIRGEETRFIQIKSIKIPASYRLAPFRFVELGRFRTFSLVDLAAFDEKVSAGKRELWAFGHSGKGKEIILVVTVLPYGWAAEVLNAEKRINDLESQVVNLGRKNP